MSAVLKTFTAKRGSHLSDADAETVGSFLEGRFNGDPFEAEDVVAAARPKRSEIHGYFEWDDGRAAHQHRLDQARALVRSIQVVIVEPDADEGAETRAFHHVVVSVDSDDGGEPTTQAGYVTQEVVFSQPDLADQVVRKSARELRNWAERTRQYESLAGFAPRVERIADEIEGMLNE